MDEEKEAIIYSLIADLEGVEQTLNLMIDYQKIDFAIIGLLANTAKNDVKALNMLLRK